MDDNQIINRSYHLLAQEYKFRALQTEDALEHSQDLFNIAKQMSGDDYYRSLRYIVVKAKRFELYGKNSTSMIDKIRGLCIKYLHMHDDDNLEKYRIDCSSKLEKIIHVREQKQQDLVFCDMCSGRELTDYITDDLVDGYHYLQDLPQVELYAKDRTPAQMKGQVSPLQRRYINMAHWMHHELENRGLYDYVKRLPKILFKHQNATISIKTWDLLHVCLGDLKRGFFTGVHIEDPSLFTYFYQRDTVNKISVRGHDKYSKVSTFFASEYDMEKCVDKACQALQNIVTIQPGDSKYGADNLIVTGKTHDNEQIIIVVDPNKQHIVSFYPA